MDSGVVCVVVKSDRYPGRIPAVGESVRLEGYGGIFLVLSVDREGRQADLMEKSSLRHQIMHDVPFVSLRTIHHSLVETVLRFLNSR